MDPIGHTISVPLDEVIFSRPVKEEEKNEASRNYLSQWKMAHHFHERITSHFTDHALAFALYLIPLFGEALKFCDGFYFSLDLPQDMPKSPINGVKESHETLKDRVAQLQVNDVIYYVAKLTQIAACIVLGITTTNVVNLLLFSSAAVALLVSARASFGAGILNALERKNQVFDLALCNHLLDRARALLPAHQRQRARNIFISLHNFFRYKEKDVAAEAKKIIESKSLDYLDQALGGDQKAHAYILYLLKRIKTIENLSN